MVLKDEFLNYLKVAKKDANKKDKGLISELSHVFYRKKILDKPEFAKKIAMFIALLYYYMPEIPKADPRHLKVLRLSDCCVKLAADEPGKRHKPGHR